LKYQSIISFLLFFNIAFSQKPWFGGNLKGIENLILELNIKGVDDDTWEKRIYSLIKLRLLEHDLQIVDGLMPKMVVDIHIIDSRVEKTSSHLVMLSIYGYSIREPDYYQSMSDKKITKHVMTSKVFGHEIMGQTSSKNLYRDVEISINKLISIMLDQWYKDNPMNQF